MHLIDSSNASPSVFPLAKSEPDDPLVVICLACAVGFLLSLIVVSQNTGCHRILLGNNTPPERLEAIWIDVKANQKRVEEEKKEKELERKICQMVYLRRFPHSGVEEAVPPIRKSSFEESQTSGQKKHVRFAENS